MVWGWHGEREEGGTLESCADARRLVFGVWRGWRGGGERPRSACLPVTVDESCVLAIGFILATTEAARLLERAPIPVAHSSARSHTLRANKPTGPQPD